MRAIVCLLLLALHTAVSAASLGDFASALAVPANAKHLANNWNALKPIKGITWRDTTLSDMPSAFAQEGDFALNNHGRATALVVGTRQMMLDVEVSMPRSLEKKGLAQTLQAQFSPSTFIEQIGGECRQRSGGSRVYRVTLPSKRPLFMRLEGLPAGTAAANKTKFSLSIDNKPQWSC